MTCSFLIRALIAATLGLALATCGKDPYPALVPFESLTPPPPPPPGLIEGLQAEGAALQAAAADQQTQP